MLTYSSVGVIYGDIGTSPLYTYASIFSFFTPTEDQIIGATSLILWGLTLIVMTKYCCESPSLLSRSFTEPQKSPGLLSPVILQSHKPRNPNEQERGCHQVSVLQPVSVPIVFLARQCLDTLDSRLLVMADEAVIGCSVHHDVRRQWRGRYLCAVQVP